jgi:membrane protease YdiL (CAAX protease family)
VEDADRTPLGWTPPAADLGPPRWIGWLLIVAGIVVAVIGLTVVAAVLQGLALGAEVAGIALAVGGTGAIAVGMGLFAVRAIRSRAGMAPERYRGPSVLLLFGLALVIGNLLAVGSVVAAARDPNGLSGAGTIIGLLLIGPLAFIGVVAGFVLLPKALAGWNLIGPHPAALLGLGIGLGLASWLLATALEVAISVAYQAVVGQPPDAGQAVIDLANDLPPAAAFVLVAGIVPFAEELFFRGFVYSAWERERGPRFALYGSAGLFTAAHLGSSSLMVLPAILALGLVLGLAFRRWRSLPLNVGLHGTFNAISLALLFLGVRGV